MWIRMYLINKTSSAHYTHYDISITIWNKRLCIRLRIRELKNWIKLWASTMRKKRNHMFKWLWIRSISRYTHSWHIEPYIYASDDPGTNSKSEWSDIIFWDSSNIINARGYFCILFIIETLYTKQRISWIDREMLHMIQQIRLSVTR